MKRLDRKRVIIELFKKQICYPFLSWYILLCRYGARVFHTGCQNFYTCIMDSILILLVQMQFPISGDLMTVGGMLGLVLLKIFDSKHVLRWFTIFGIISLVLGLTGSDGYHYGLSRLQAFFFR